MIGNYPSIYMIWDLRIDIKLKKKSYCIYSFQLLGKSFVVTDFMCSSAIKHWGIRVTGGRGTAEEAANRYPIENKAFSLVSVHCVSFTLKEVISYN